MLIKTGYYRSPVTPDVSLTAALGLGFVLGIRHAMDADHLAAMSTLVSQHRSVARACLLGAFWGAGHTAALVVAGVAVIAFRLTFPAEVERALETAVALVLILLGGNVVRRQLRHSRVHRHAHEHDGEPHTHVHVHVADTSHDHVHLLGLGGRPFAVGLLHGLAGSAALMLLVLTTIPSPTAQVLYILLFGVGSTGGMLALSGIIGIPFALTAARAPAAHRAVQLVAGAGSVVLGIWLVWKDL
jgi:ABC-type nickel/cobalt efflux system permease component RcnA